VRAATRVLLAAAVAVCALLGAAAPAGAHAYLTESDPADQAQLDAPPEQLVLRFSESVRAPTEDAVRVVDAGGERVDTGLVVREGLEVAVGLPDDLGPGTFVATWSVVSEDSHVVRGGATFTVMAPPTAPEPAGPPADDGAEQAPAGVTAPPPADGPDVEALLAHHEPPPALERAATVLTGVGYAGTLLAAGGALFLAVVLGAAARSRRPRPVDLGAAAATDLADPRPAPAGGDDRPTALGVTVAAAATVGAVAAVAGWVLHAALVAGDGLGVAASPARVAELAGGDVTRSAWVRALALAVLVAAVPAWRRGRRWAPVLMVGAGAVAVASFAFTGHTTVTEPRGLVVPTNVLHTAAAAAWFGGLVVLAVLLWRRGDEDAAGTGALMARFSGLAAVAVAGVAGAGLVLAVAEVRTLGALTSTGYGQVLLAKVAAVAGVGVVGLANHRRLVPRLVEHPTAEVLSRLRWAVSLELLGLVAAVALTAVLVDLVPARSAVPADPQPFSTTVAVGADMEVDVLVLPARPGPNELHLDLRRDGLPLDEAPQELLVRLAPPDGGPPVEQVGVSFGPSHHQVRAGNLTVAGDWTAEIVVRLADGERRGELTVPLR
jgi:copper transport protein